jgi:peptidyl-prolyl cis-trans isomerase SurA
VNFLAFFLFFICVSNSRAELLDRILAIVGEQPILWSDVKTLSTDLKANPHMASSLELKRENVSTDKVLDVLIQQALIRHVLKENRADVKEADVQKQVNTIATQNNLSVEQLKASLQKEGISFQSYQNNIRYQLEKRAIFDNEIRHSANAAVSEADLRSEFIKNVQTESNLLLIVTKNTKAGAERLKSLAERVNSGKLSLQSLKESEGAESLGWVSPSSLQPKFREALKNKKEGSATGPVLVNNALHLLVIEKTRKGSEEQFISMRDDIQRHLQNRQVDDLFRSWFEKKKLEIELVLNK